MVIEVSSSIVQKKEVKMKKIFLFCLLIVVSFMLFACGEAVPVKEIEDAKTAVEKAKSVEAQFYAEPEYKEAEKNLDAANELVTQKKNKEAKEKAIVSKEKAIFAYNIAITNRAIAIYTECSNLLVEIDEYYGNKVEPENYEECKNQFLNIGADLEAGKFDDVYENSKNLKLKLEEFLERLKDLYGEISTYIDEVEDRLDELSENKDVKDYAQAILEQAYEKIKEAKNALENGDYEVAREKAKEADDLCNKIEETVALKKKPEKVEEEVKEKAEKPAKDIQKDMDDALEAIKRAKEKQELLKQRKKILFKKINCNQFAIRQVPVFYLANEINLEDESVATGTTEGNLDAEVSKTEDVEASDNEVIADDMGEQEKSLAKEEEPSEEQVFGESEHEEEVDVSEETQEEELSTEVAGEEIEEGAVGEAETSFQEEIKLKDEDITEEMVNKYISIAEELYNKGEYSKSLAYASEAIRMADILLEREYTKYYRVRRGDCLWNIAKFFYKRPLLWPIIYKANKDKIKHPDLIYPNQIFKIPPAPRDVDDSKLYNKMVKEIKYKPLFR